MSPTTVKTHVAPGAHEARPARPGAGGRRRVRVGARPAGRLRRGGSSVRMSPRRRRRPNRRPDPDPAADDAGATRRRASDRSRRSSARPPGDGRSPLWSPSDAHLLLSVPRRPMAARRRADAPSSSRSRAAPRRPRPRLRARARTRRRESCSAGRRRRARPWRPGPRPRRHGPRLGRPGGDRLPGQSTGCPPGGGRGQRHRRGPLPGGRGRGRRPAGTPGARRRAGGVWRHGRWTRWHAVPVGLAGRRGPRLEPGAAGVSPSAGRGRCGRPDPRRGRRGPGYAADHRARTGHQPRRRVRGGPHAAGRDPRHHGDGWCRHGARQRPRLGRRRRQRDGRVERLRRPVRLAGDARERRRRSPWCRSTPPTTCRSAGGCT